MVKVFDSGAKRPWFNSRERESLKLFLSSSTQLLFRVVISRFAAGLVFLPTRHIESFIDEIGQDLPIALTFTPNSAFLSS